ncbi:exonuclease V subunit alpha [Mycobacteroides abscessus subsp. massiliense]|nr:MobF family relaxase [Mycobacteroides abscessus]SKM23389.1 exonuclease V subunit alpha [Mycobacteroides abscessus subsp. abscessus]SKM87641.1 exonuclease V subunit alpha [Mycobacteroides abscessus subsp. massiliense]SKO00646.1 exonuclease V subunit alpha [Mycobacteroides abscessus subsp. massiliense]SKO06937.1 exonuclease V subunit alpha [Mycobacteroides abscessus subsp. massiliense]SKO24839.1 exonuclease V subunit alpha [Mycobacteroides abscessus subsp. massiliense]
MHKLTAGDGYLYLVRQVAAADSTERGRSSLADYYSAKGESPGRWAGRGLAALADTGAREVSDEVRQQVWTVEGGSVVTEEQMKALFGLGLHPNADKISDHLSPRLSVRPSIAATQLGRKYAVREESSEFTRRVGKAFRAHNIEAGLAGSATIDDDVRASIRTRVAREMFAEQFGRAPADERELSGFVARATRARTTAVAGYDLTFSPVKSISALWAIAPPEISEQIEAAHEAAVADVLEWLQDNAAFTRTGTNGVAQVDTEGLIAAVFTHRDSRAGDPDLHTHVAISNKVSYLDHNGVRRWLALDGQPLHRLVVAASEMYNTRMEAHTIDRLGVDFAEASRGRGKRPVREIVGMSAKLMTRWSSRSIAIKARTAELAKQFQHDHGREPTTIESLALAQQATLESREAKHEPRSLAEQRDTWRHQAVEVLGHDGVERMLAGVLATERGHTTPEITDEWVASQAGALIATVSESRATWQRHHVRAEALRVVRNEGVAHVSQLVERLTATALSEAFSVPHARIDDAELGEPVALRRRDGSSVYSRHGTATFTSREVLAAEARIRAAAHQLDGRVAAPADVGLALADAAARGKTLNEGQAALVAQMALGGRRVALALAPAGAGKTTAMAALAHAWRSSGGQVLGLAPTAAAAIVLGEDLGARTDTLDKYVHCTDENNAAIYGTPDWFDQVGPQTLIVVDEAGMASTAGLDAMISHALSRGASVRLVGDDGQLASISAGGVLRDIATDTGALTLSEVVRFHSRAEAAASLALRGGDPAGIGFYLDAGRIHIGTEQTAADVAFTAWQADQDAGSDSLLLAPTNAIVNELNARARTARLAAALEADPHATPGRETMLSDGLTASVGDVIRTRRNNRQLPLSVTDYVRNGYTFTIVDIAPDGALKARHRGTGREITLPADYVTDHVTLGYAATIDAAQGSTAGHACHVVGAEHLTRQHLYVALTRGRAENHLYLSTAETDPHRILAPKATHPDTAVDVLSRIVARDGAQVSATTAARAAADPGRRLAAAADMFTDALATAAEQQLGAGARARLDALAESVHPGLSTCTAWPVLRRRLAIRALSGADLGQLLTAAHARGGLDDAADPAAVLDYRIDLTGSDGRDCGPLRWLPAIPTALAENPHWGDYLRRREQLVTDLADQIREHARSWTTETAPPWARPLITANANPTLTAEIAVFRAATAVEAADTRLTGSPQYPVATRAVQDLLQRHGIDAIEHSRPDTTQWHDLLDAIDPRIRADDYWPTLAAQLAEAAHTNDIHQLLTDAAHHGPLPDEMPAAALWWRITDTAAMLEPQQPVEHASDRALVEVLAAAHRNGDPLPLPAPQPKPVAIALTIPYVVTTLAADHDTPELAEAIAAAAAHAGRDYLRVPARRQYDRYSLAELAEKITDHQPSRRRPPVIVVEDAAAADPAHLAVVATTLADAHGRLLLIDNGQPGPGRRLLDGMALPWSENTNPTTEIDDPRLAAAVDNHRAAAAKRWRNLTNLLGPDRGRGRDRDQGYEVDID